MRLSVVLTLCQLLFTYCHSPWNNHLNWSGHPHFTDERTELIQWDPAFVLPHPYPPCHPQSTDQAPTVENNLFQDRADLSEKTRPLRVRNLRGSDSQGLAPTRRGWGWTPDLGKATRLAEGFEKDLPLGPLTPTRVPDRHNHTPHSHHCMLTPPRRSSLLPEHTLPHAGSKALTLGTGAGPLSHCQPGTTLTSGSPMLGGKSCG